MVIRLKTVPANKDYAGVIMKVVRGAKQKKIVAMQITENGMVVYPEQEVFSEISSDLE